MDEDMARGRHGYGTFDRSTSSWRLRTKELSIKASIRRLSEVFGEPIPCDERKSYPFWKRYLEAARAYDVMVRENELANTIGKRLAADPHDFKLRDGSAVAMDVEKILEASDFAPAEWIGKIVTTTARPKDSLANEVEVEIERKKAKGNRSWYCTKKYLNFFAASAGSISVHEISIHHFRAFWKALATTTWGERTRFNCQNETKTFLRRVSANFNVSMPFLDSPEFRMECPEGSKTQWTFEQVQTALKESTGVVRTMVLLGLNAGMYIGDIFALEQGEFDGERIETCRAKLEHRKNAFVGSWKLWGATKEALTFGAANYKQMERAFKEFRDLHGLPEQSDLRKTVAQWLEDKVSDEVARLYRCEKLPGTHGKSYIRFSDEQKAKLDAGLEVVAKFLGLS